MPTRSNPTPHGGMTALAAQTASAVSKKDQQIQELQEQLERERDGRREDRFVGIVLLALLLDVVFFTVVSFGGALAILALELLIFIPLARRLGMEEIAQISGNVLHRLAGKVNDSAK